MDFVGWPLRATLSGYDEAPSSRSGDINLKKIIPFYFEPFRMKNVPSSSDQKIMSCAFSSPHEITRPCPPMSFNLNFQCWRQYEKGSILIPKLEEVWRGEGAE